MTKPRPPLEQLRAVPILADLSDQELDWLIENGRYEEFPVGAVPVEQGAPADKMVIMLAGRLEFRFPTSTESLIIEPGSVTGLLPFSRMTHFVGMGRALTPMQTLSIYKPDFMPMLNAIPALGQRLVGMLTDRVRNWSQQELRQEKLASLGKLSAGLAHELNNPASAAKRASAGLLEAFNDLELTTARVGQRLGADGMELLLGHLQTLRPRLLSAMERADLEDELGGWLEGHGAAAAWDKAATWADAGVTVDWLEALSHLKHEIADPATLPMVWAWLEASIRTRSQLGVIQDSTERIAGLVKAIKGYTHMDQMPKQELDIHDGLESTIAIFGYKLKKGIRLERDYAKNLPKVDLYASEINQVWTNLIDNALDAMGEGGTLRIRTAREGGQILVEIGDSGPGIPPEIQGRIFDAFFTTKEVGKGTGLGLEMVRRIVQQHGGTVRLQSKPGDTRFQVRLPVPAAA
ncbi:MAG: ATP-binding protein [Meiothermus sp.]|nr:ATP-binding protein [Meiothermus sp.]